MVRQSIGKMFILTLFFISVSTTHAEDILASYPRGPMFGGKSNETEEMPYLVTIFRNEKFNKQRLCSGLLISKNIVLTTAHCLFHKYRLSLRINSVLHRFYNTEYEVQNFRFHDNFYISKHGLPVNDLALLKFKIPPNENHGRFNPMTDLDFETIVLFNATEVVSAGVDANITGWAKIDGLNEEDLTFRTVQILDTSLCDKAYDSVGGVPAGQMCAAYPGADGRDGCQGDRGSPLMIGGRVAGILSWGNGCVKSYYPGVYTKIAYYRDWIEQNRSSL